MTVTADLRPDEIEITVKCRQPECEVTTTHAYNQTQVQLYGMPALRKQSFQIVRDAHKSGKHKTYMEEYYGR